MPLTNPRCELCRYWSDRVVRIVNSGPIEAACLCPASPNAGQFVTAGVTCAAFRAGICAVDSAGGERRAAA